MRFRSLKGLSLGGAVAVALSLVVSTAAFAQEGMRPLTLADYLSWETVQSPPDLSGR